MAPSLRVEMTPQWVDLLGAGRAALKEKVAGHRECSRRRRCGLDELSTVHSERRIGFHNSYAFMTRLVVGLALERNCNEWST